MNRTAQRFCAAALSNLFATLLLSLIALTALAQSSQSASALLPENVSPEQGIPLPEIATRAEQIKRPLREIAGRLSSNSTIISSISQLEVWEAQINAQALQIEERIATTPTLYELRELERDWRLRSIELTRWQKTLAQQVVTAEADWRWLKDEQTRWEKALEQVGDADSLEAIFERIRSTLSEIQALQTRAQERLSQLLSLQDRVSQQDLMVSTELDSILLAKQRFQGQLLARDHRPLWAAFSSQPETQSADDAADRSFVHELAAARESVNDQKLNFILLVILFVTALLLNISLAKKIAPLTTDDEALHQSARVLKRPVSVAMLITLLTYLWLAPLSASIINSIVALLLLIPFLRVARLLVEPPSWLRIPFYILAILHLSDQIRFLADISPVIERVIFLTEVAIAIAVIVWMMRPARFGQLSGSELARKWLRGALWTMLVLLAISLLANVFGFVTLAKVLGEGALHSTYVGALLYAAARVVIITLALLLRTQRAQILALVRFHRDEITLWFARAAYFIVGFMWLNASLELFTIREQVFAALTQLLDASLRFRSLNISIGDVLSFLFVIVAAYYLARLVRIILQEDVLTRMPLKRGVPQAIATAAQYLMLLLGFVLALTAAGFELNKLTLLTGAFGVGIGFGLQNIVNNFVSGLILLFERPVQVGDAVQIGGVSGDVTRIGIRSSTISTYQGADVIIPNAKLISDDVTNWTLTNQVRRVEIQVGVAYGTDPETVSKLLSKIAKSNSDVLRAPEPFTLFTGFGDSSLNFELRFWTAFQAHTQIKSRVSMAIAVALSEAGIDVPFPQRDLRVKLDTESLKEALREQNDSASSSE